MIDQIFGVSDNQCHILKAFIMPSRSERSKFISGAVKGEADYETKHRIQESLQTHVEHVQCP